MSWRPDPWPLIFLLLGNNNFFKLIGMSVGAFLSDGGVQPSGTDSRRQLFQRRLGMKSVWKLLCLLGLIVLVTVMAFAYIMPSQLPQPAELDPILSVVMLLATGCAVWGIYAVFTKRYTSATGFG
jgi:hypothetical protein